MIKDKEMRDDLVNLYILKKDQWILIYHENPYKLKSKWFESYQIIEKKFLDIYWFQDSNDKELAILIYDNRLI